MYLRPVGVVRSSVGDAGAMPRRGVPARVEVFEVFAPALLHIEANSHVVVVGWLHEANRARLHVQRPGHGRFHETRGVFACRAPERPNPLGITTARLLRVEGTSLYFDSLDMIDGTPVVDLKPHAHGLDSAFAARSAREMFGPDHLWPAQALDALLLEAERFHGERCRGIALGARALFHWMEVLNVGQKDEGTVVWVGNDGCLADALQALTGATLGNGRLRVDEAQGTTFRLRREGKTMRFAPRQAISALLAEQAMQADVAELFDLDFSEGN